jgi:hypothetical protein
MESSLLIETKIAKTRHKEMPLPVFATYNDLSKVSGPLKSKFIALQWKSILTNNSYVGVVNSQKPPTLFGGG